MNRSAIRSSDRFGAAARPTTGGVTTLTLNRPAQFNAINSAMLGELQSALEAIGRDDSVRVVVLAGAGRAFCPGHDLKEMLANSNEAFIGDLFRRCCDVMLTLQRLAATGDRESARHRDGRRLPARRRLRSRGRRRRRAVRHLGHQLRIVLRDARRAGVAQHRRASAHSRCS